MSQSLKAYEQLREEIVAWDLSPGTHLSEVLLAERLGVSRTPLREAIQRLARENLVRITPGRGAFVTDVSLNDVTHLFQMREALETYAARLCARSAERGAFAALADDLATSADASASIERMDALIAEVAGNPYLTESLALLRGQVRRLRQPARRSPERLADATREHIAICRAIADGDEDAAATAVVFHIGVSLNTIASMLVGGPVTGADMQRDGALRKIDARRAVGDL
ncbi:GntR family transcriptional regulator [Lentzea sp. JNUCC 0626]|uniref:GntR family transcriptional regulator n=1 Tax=Lentzea sp. JNUCC 0626 TaxID=3367513 RepID=UPI003747BD1F